MSRVKIVTFAFVLLELSPFFQFFYSYFLYPFRVRTISPMFLIQLISNFICVFVMMRGCVVRKNHNSRICTFGVIPLFPFFLLTFPIPISCPDHIFYVSDSIDSKFYRCVCHDERVCRAQES